MDERRKDDKTIIDLIKATTEQKAAMDYIKESLDEIKQEIKTLKASNINACSDCEAMRKAKDVEVRFEEYVKEHEEKRKFNWTTVISFITLIGLLLTLFLQLLKVI